MEKIGLIAGNRKFPILFAQAYKKRDYFIVAVAVRGETSPRLKKFVDKLYWLRISQFFKLLEIFKNEGITKVVMAGQINPRRLFSKDMDRDKQLKDFLASIENKKADTIFGAVAERLKDSGFELIDSTLFLEDHLPKKGTLTKQEPNFSEWEDIYFGLDLARKIACLDIGQTLAVKNKAVVAVEALEGTDNLIRRAGKVARGKIIVVKVSKPTQDLRFDIPVVGLTTIKNLIKAGARCLVIEADKTLFIDKEESISLADKHGLEIVAV